MSIDEFFKECEKKGITPVSYKESSWGLNGSKTVEYVNPEYARAREMIARVLNRGRQNNRNEEGIDSLVSDLLGERIVIKTKFGYHHGKLVRWSDKGFILGDYLFSKGPMELMDYETEFFYGGDTLIPADGIITVSRIPEMFGEF